MCDNYNTCAKIEFNHVVLVFLRTPLRDNSDTCNTE